ncbi:MAG: glycosyltransferase family 4 protein [Clostridia bacterium]|nr:glycosyltransferase family 4 protein [Clostridia bacterium]
MILHICCNLAGSTVFPQMFEALRDEGLEQIVFVPEKRKRDMGKNQPEGVETLSALTVRRSDAVFFSRKAKRTVPAIEEAVDMSRVNLMHAHTLFTDGSIALALHQKYDIPFIVTLRYSDIEAIWKYEPHLHGMAREILRAAQRVVFLSGAARDKVLGKWLRSRDRALVEPKTAVIPNGIAPEWLDGTARGGCEHPLRVGFAGKMTKRKRPLDALEAVHRATETGMPCVLRAVGEGKLMNDLVAGLHEGDAYLGVAGGMDAMKRFYAGVDVLLVPSSAETFGMVYLEAMSQGVPVLYTRGQGFDGQFDEGKVGYSVVCGDTKQQAQMLQEIVKDYAQRSGRCAELAKGYAWPIIAKKWMELYEMK